MGAGSGRRAALRNKKGSLVSFFFPSSIFLLSCLLFCLLYFFKHFWTEFSSDRLGLLFKGVFLGICFFSFRFYKTFFFPVCVWQKKASVKPSG